MADFCLILSLSMTLILRRFWSPFAPVAQLDRATDF